MRKYQRLLSLVAVLLVVALIGLASVFASAQPVRGDMNNDGAINMKDVLLLRKYLADMDVAIEDISCGDVTGDEAVNMKDVLLLRKFLAEMDVTLYSPAETEASGVTEATASVTETSATQASESSATQASETSATQASTSESSATQASETSATQASESSATQASETSATQATAATQASESAATQATQSQYTGETVTLSLSVVELVDNKYNPVTRTDSFQVPKDQETTFIITLPGYYKGNTTDMTVLLQNVSLTANGAAITPDSVTFGTLADQKCDVYYTYKINMTEDVTVAGTVEHPNYAQFSISVNGEGGITPTQASTEPKETYAAPLFLTDENAETVIDRVTLSFYDKDSTRYGITFHSYETLTNPVVQYVQGANQTEAAFASAASANATTEQLDGFMTYNYNPTDFTFTATYEDRNNCNGNMPETDDYTHKAALPVLSYNTTYSYRVGGQNADGEQVWSPIYSFTTRKADPGSNFSFIWMSDSQYDSYTVGIQNRMKNVLNAALSICPNPDMMIHGGDFANDGGYLWGYAAAVSGNEDFFSKYPLMATSGNHDTSGGTKEIYRLINIDLNGTGRDSSQSTSTGMYYSFDYGDAHFTCLNIAKDAAIDDTQLAWLTNDLASTSKTWKFVYFHRPIYTAPRGDYKSEENKETELNNMSILASKLSPVFEQYGVDVALQAHVHMYSRSKPITDGVGTIGSYTTSTVNGYEYYVNPTGVVYTETATAAATTDKIARAIGSDPVEDYIATYADGQANSFAIYTVNGNTLSVDACYATDAGVVSYYDKFGIIKSVS